MSRYAAGPAYRGRFAPSPTGLLHAGSLVAALASWLDARAHGGQWLVRIEDHDQGRCVPGADQAILAQLQTLGLMPDEPPVWQSQRQALYARALQRLMESGWVYGCDCTRKSIADALAAQAPGKPRHGELVYPGTCRHRHLGPTQARAWRLLSTADLAGTQDLTLSWQDRRLGPQQQSLSEAVGDFVLRRADGLWAYQLCVVVDDADQGITDVVRGEDLADNTPRQIRLQQLLGLPALRYLHTPLVLGANGEKLSKQNGARPLDLDQPLATLQRAGAALGLNALPGTTIADWLAAAVRAWTAAGAALL
ncbi:tRNA glutamyl-Q(34) synthetase GluQRS [Mitsuaria sp. WAJ17]|uniref:tRNA glutamyl-Q(34) synthetase GluQRS n=1 Tax=Mitsuaria sp. WAJ17 TaxID=2761452 RepID=UPI0015FFDDDB|nr:tRNA glutamyl-Q(34) synthetase GluQRS [Mitsuaria sp. WAJ17]MBB2485621.1 tRNA glutamyl-Q(34) synthetase GluQRS [Mitsuaria sp. WAJ17]